MAQVKIIHGDAADYPCSTDLILTDPPYEMRGKKLAEIINPFSCDHLVLITTMKQLIEFLAYSDWKLNFDFVIDGVAPKKSKSLTQPNYVHQTGVYLTRNKAKSIFNRKMRMRSDTYEENGYWPTIFRAPRDRMHDHGHAKNADVFTDVLGSFSAASVCDPFAGSGTTAVAAWDLEIACTLIESDAATFGTLKELVKFMSVYGLEIIE